MAGGRPPTWLISQLVRVEFDKPNQKNVALYKACLSQIKQRWTGQGMWEKCIRIAGVRVFKR